MYGGLCYKNRPQNENGVVNSIRMLLKALKPSSHYAFSALRPLILYRVNVGAVKNIEWEIADAVDAMDARMVAKVTQRFGHVQIYFY